MEIGQTIFVLGPNGSGKSALLHHFHGQIGSSAKWIRAHRRSSLSSNAPEMTTASFLRDQQQYTHSLAQHEARYRETYRDGSYGDNAITELIHRHNANARTTHDAVRSGDCHAIAERRHARDIIEDLNSILRQSNIRLAIEIGPMDDLVAKKGDVSYGVDQMSDGERSAFLLVSSVLTAPATTLFLIDEPETHLHHSIASPLLSRLFASRPDCSFVVAAHQVALPMDNSEAAVLLLRDCTFREQTPATWDLDFIENTQDIPDDFRAEVLGARKIVVFVEGELSSLDYPLYASVLPGVSVIPVGSCLSVKNAVDSMDTVSSHHHMKCFGVIDRDHRQADELARLQAERVFTVDGYSIESIYYDKRVQRMVVKRIAGSDLADERLDDSKRRALKALSEQKENMCSASAVARIRQSTRDQINDQNLECAHIKIPMREVLDDEAATFQDALDRCDLDLLIRRYPVRKSAALNEMAKALGFRNREAYEGAVVKLLQNDETALRYVSERFAELLSAIHAHDNLGDLGHGTERS